MAARSSPNALGLSRDIEPLCLVGILRAVHDPALGRLPLQHVFTAQLASVLRTMVLDNRGVAARPGDRQAIGGTHARRYRDDE
jgi:hypothetical protein